MKKIRNKWHIENVDQLRMTNKDKNNHIDVNYEIILRKTPNSILLNHSFPF